MSVPHVQNAPLYINGDFISLMEIAASLLHQKIVFPVFFFSQWLKQTI